MAPRGTLLSLVESREDSRNLIASFDHLAAPEILFGLVKGIENHAFDLLVGKPVTGLHLDLGFFTAALLACRDMKNAIRVDEELDFDAGHAGSHGWNPSKIEPRQRATVLCQFTFPLQHVNGNIRLPIHLRGVELRG